MNFGEAIASGFRNYVNFNDRADRPAYWYWVLFGLLLGIVTAILDSAIFPVSAMSPLNTIAGLVLLLPGLAVSVRRLHDIDRTGWWVLLALSIIGALVLIYWACQPGTRGPNRFGPDPKAHATMSM